MGDTGSLAIGGMIGVVAICCKQELLLVVVGGVFVIEAVSVILQVLSFKLTGKRIFAMSPLHHHFELTGWKENTVIVRFWILSVIFALLGLGHPEIEIKRALRESKRCSSRSRLERSAAALLLRSEGADVTVLDSAEEKNLLKSTIDNLRAQGCPRDLRRRGG